MSDKQLKIDGKIHKIAKIKSAREGISMKDWIQLSILNRAGLKPEEVDEFISTSS